MINQNDLFRRWLDFQATNPPKIQGGLEKVDSSNNVIGRCCLGNLCHIAGIERSVERNVGGNCETYYNWIKDVLPTHLAIKLNIEANAKFTCAGARYAFIFLREYMCKRGSFSENPDYSPFGLADINDNYDVDHKIIGELISHLAWIEKHYGIQCFESNFDIFR